MTAEIDAINARLNRGEAKFSEVASALSDIRYDFARIPARRLFVQDCR